MQTKANLVENRMVVNTIIEFYLYLVTDIFSIEMFVI